MVVSDFTATEKMLIAQFERLGVIKNEELLEKKLDCKQNMKLLLLIELKEYSL